MSDGVNTYGDGNKTWQCDITTTFEDSLIFLKKPFEFCIVRTENIATGWGLVNVIYVKWNKDDEWQECPQEYIDRPVNYNYWEVEGDGVKEDDGRNELVDVDDEGGEIWEQEIYKFPTD